MNETSISLKTNTLMCIQTLIDTDSDSMMFGLASCHHLPQIDVVSQALFPSHPEQKQIPDLSVGDEMTFSEILSV